MGEEPASYAPRSIEHFLSFIWPCGAYSVTSPPPSDLLSGILSGGGLP